MKTNGINFVVGYEEINLGLGLNDTAASKMLAPVIKTIQTDTLSEALEPFLSNVAVALEKCSLDSTQYTLGDVELSLTISANGEVSILSAAQIAGGAEASLKVTLKRKE